MSEQQESSDSARFGLAALAAFARTHYATILAGILAVVFVYFTALPEDRLMAPLQTRNVARWLLIGIFFILLFFGHRNKYELFRIMNGVLVPVTVVMILIYVWLDAWAADELSREEKVIEDFSFVFLMIGTVCLGVVGGLLLRKREFLTVAISILGAVIFFVIGMEEISWFQRVLEVDSSEFFRNVNGQGEMNFHNIYTHESEDIYYLGGFVLLGVLPFFRDELATLLDRINQSAAKVILPPAWLIIPFVLAGAFVAQDFASRSANVTVVLGSLILIIGMMHRHFSRKEWGRLAQAVSSFAIMIFAIILLLSLDFVSQDVRPWIGKEYQEFYIAWGIGAYGVSVLAQYLEQRPPRRISSESA